MNEHIEKVRAAVEAHKARDPEPLHTLRLELWTSNSWRRFHFQNGGPACEPIAQRDGHPDLHFPGGPDGPVARRMLVTWNALVGYPTGTLEDQGFIGSINAACEARKALLDVLTDALEFVEAQEDADCVDGQFVGNRAMGLAQEIREVVAKHTPKVKP